MKNRFYRWCYYGHEAFFPIFIGGGVIMVIMAGGFRPDGRAPEYNPELIRSTSAALFAIFWLLASIVTFIQHFLFYFLDYKQYKNYSLPVNKKMLVVSNLGEDSVFYRAGLRNNDLIVAIDGEELDADCGLDKWWRRRGSIALRVLRNSQEIQIVVVKD